MPEDNRPDATRSANLQGWKDIASYLGRSVRSVQRWESEIGLPVHRIKNTDGQTVYAVPAEINEWRKSRDLPKPLPEDIDSANEGALVPEPMAAVRESRSGFKWLWVTAASLALLAAGLLGGYYLNQPKRLVASLQTAGTDVVAYDARGQMAWHHDAGEQISRADGDGAGADPGTLFVDLDADGRSEALVAVRYSRPGRAAPKSDVLMAFDGRGKVRWTFTPDLHLTCGDGEYSGPWRIYDVLVTHTSDKPRIFIAINHGTWWPGLVLELDTTGHGRTRLLQTGWVRGLSEWKTDEGHYIAATGVSNEYNRPSVAIFDIDGPPAMMPFADRRFDCRDAPTAPPVAAFMFPNLDLLGSTPYAFALNPVATDQGLKVSLNFPTGAAVASIEPSLHNVSISLSDKYWAQHLQLESEGLIKHTADNCPEAVRPQRVEVWNRNSGWTHTLVTPTDRRASAKAAPR